PCNWVQIIENNMDSVHLVFLHSKLSGPQFNESHGLLPQLKWQETPIGVMSTQTRRVGPNVWSRNSEIIWPNLNQFQPTWEDGKTPHVPKGLLREPRPPIPTYCHDAVISAPAGSTPEEESQIRTEIETRVATRYYLEYPGSAR